MSCGRGFGGLDQFGGFLGDLVEHLRGFGPVEPHARCPLLQLQCAQQGGQPHGDSVQNAGLRLVGTFGGLDRLPIAGLLLGRFIAAFVAENMRVAGHHLVGDGIGHVLKGEQATVIGNLGMKHHLQQKIAQFAAQLVPVGTLDGVGDLVSLFDGVGGDGAEILLDVPRAAAVGIAQPAHDLEQSGHAAVGVMSCRVFWHGRGRPSVGSAAA